MCRGAVARGSNGAVAYCLELALEERNAAPAPCGYFSDDHVDREGGQVLLERGQNAHNHAASPGAMICLAGLSRGSRLGRIAERSLRTVVGCFHLAEQDKSEQRFVAQASHQFTLQIYEGATSLATSFGNSSSQREQRAPSFSSSSTTRCARAAGPNR